MVTDFRSHDTHVFEQESAVPRESRRASHRDRRRGDGCGCVFIDLICVTCIDEPEIDCQYFSNVLFIQLELRLGDISTSGS